MAALVGKRVRTRPPQPGEALFIDWSNPITAGLVFAYVCGNEAVGWGEDGRAVLLYQNGRQINTLTGQAAQALASNQAVFSPSQASVTSGVYSLFAFGTCPGGGRTQSVLDDDDNVIRRLQFRVNASNKVEFIPFYGGGNGSVAAAATLTSNDLAAGFAMGAVANGTAYAVYQKGVKTSGATLPGKILALNPSIWVGARKASNSQNWAVGGLQVVALWNRAQADAEQQSLADNPWQLFKPAARRLWMPRSASAAYVLQAAAGAFAWSVSEAALLAARRLMAGVGALAAGWNSASLRVSRRLPGAAGVFTMTGSTVSIMAARKIAAGVGGFGVAGAPAPLVVARRLPAQTAAFTLSAGGVQMVYTPAHGAGGPTYTLTATAGAFALTAAAAGVLARRRLVATSTAFAWSVPVASLQVGRRLPADVLAFVIAGADAQLRYRAKVAYARAPAGVGYVPLQHYHEARPSTTSAARSNKAGPARPAATQRNFR